MTKFNAENKKGMLTIGECLHPAMKITDKEDAQQYLVDYTAYLRSFMAEDTDEKGRTAEEVAKINLGYFAGYFDHETRLRVEALFDCQHPFFGKAKEGAPTPAEAFATGVSLGLRRR